jgi:hypothetical protein
MTEGLISSRTLGRAAVPNLPRYQLTSSFSTILLVLRARSNPSLAAGLALTR